MQVNMISPSSLLYEDIRDSIYNDRFLRELAKPTDFIWQQMSWGNFEKLFNSKSFFFKAYSEYDDYDEKKLAQFIINAGKKADSIEKIKRDLEKIEHQMFISCWYNSPDLSDIVFKQYTGLGGGIAIGTHVEKLLDCIKLMEAGDFNCEFYAGNVQYVPQSQLDNEQLFEKTQIIAPIFLKGLQFQMDKEFRVCAYASKQTPPEYNSEKNKESRSKNAAWHVKWLANCMECKHFELKEIEKIDTDLRNDNKTVSIEDVASESFKFSAFENVIERIAIINSGVCATLDKNTIIQFFKERLNIEIEPMPEADKNASGFRIFKIINKK